VKLPMNTDSRRSRNRQPRPCVLERVEDHLRRNAPSFHAQRIELLGQAMFGDLWEVRESKKLKQQEAK